MAYDPTWGGGGGGGGGYSPTGFGGGGSSARSGTSKKPRKSEPTHDLGNSLVRLARTLHNVSGDDKARVMGTIKKQSQDLPKAEYQRLIASLPKGAMRGLLKEQRQIASSNKATESSALGHVINAEEAVVGKVFNTVAAPERGVMSGIAEYSRKYEKEGRPLIPSAKWSDTFDILGAAAKGFQNQRHDSPQSIAKEAGDIRHKQGVSTKAFGTLPGSPTLPWKNDLRTNPIGGGKAGNIVYDVGGSIVFDPFTYASFGLGGLAKAGIRGSVEALGAERTAALVEHGMKALNAEEKARLADTLAPKVFKALEKGARGGVKMAFPRLPTPKNLAEGKFLGEPTTIIPGPLRGLRASKIIEGTAGQSGKVRAAAQAAEEVAQESSSRAKQLHAAADLAETQGAAADHVAALRSQADQFDRSATEAQATIAGLERTTQGDQVVRYAQDPLDVSTARPHGAYFAPEAADKRWKVFPNDTKISGRFVPKKPLNVEAGGAFASAGEEAARALLSDADFRHLTDLVWEQGDIPAAIRWAESKGVHFDAETAAFLEREGPTAIMDNIGGSLARRAGHDAIVKTFKGVPEEYVALHPDVLGSGVANPADLAQLAKLRTDAKAATERAAALRAEAKQASTTGARAASLRAEAQKFDQLAEQAAAKAMDVRGAASKEASTIAEHLRDTPVGRALKRAGESKIATTTRGLFIPRDAVRTKFGEGVAQQLDDARVRYRGTYQASVEDNVNTLLHAARESGVTNAELENIIGPALDIGGAGKAAAIPDKLRPMYDGLVEVRDRFTQAQLDAGVLRDQAIHVTDEYFPRILTDEAAHLRGKKIGALSPAVPGEGSVTRGPSGSLQKRTSDIGSPIPDINAEFSAEHGVPKFESNPLTAFSKRSVSAHQDIATKQYVDDVMRITDSTGSQVMRKAKDALENVPEGAEEINIPGVGRVFAPKEIANEVTKARELLINDESTRAFINGLDKWMTLWKGYATVPLPFGLGFHERNAMGNVFNNWLSGISPADGSYIKAAAIQEAMRRGAKQGDVYKFLTKADRDVVEAARRHDVVGEGFFGVDLPKNTNEPVNVPFRQASGAEKVSRVRKAANPLNSNNALISSGRKLGRAIEENARLAHFINKLEATGSAAEASRSVRQFLFDYSDLTAAERQIFKRSMAFYCVPEDHEILTRRGWLRHGDLVLGEDVMVFDPDTHAMRWEPLLDVATFDFDGDLNTIESKGGSFHFTDDHRWPIETTSGYRKVVRAHELNSASLIPWTGEFDDQGSDSLLSPRLAAILGWVVTDGYARWRGNYWQALVYQTPTKYLDEIVDLLGTKPRKPHPTTGVVPVGVALEDNKAITKHYREKADLPTLVTHLNREAAEAMWQAMFKAEGCTSAAGQQNFSQQPGPVAEAFQILSYMTGRAVWLSNGPHINNYMRRSKFLRVKEGISRTPYAGTIWCPQTPTGTWIMRHEGAVIPTGNTFTRKNLPVQLGAILRTPGKYSHIQEAREGVASQAPRPKGLYPSYLPELGGVPLPMGVSDVASKVPGLRFKPGEQIVAAPDLPLFNATSQISPAVQLLASLPGVNKIPGLPKNEEGVSGAVKDLLNSSISGGAPGALMSAIQAFGAKKDFFSGRPLEGRTAAPSYALPFASDRVLNGKRQPTITTQQQYLAESLLPILGKLSSAFPQGDYEQEKAPRRRLSTFTGLRAYPLGKGTSRGEALRRNAAIARLMADLRSKGIDIPTSRTKKKSKAGW